MRIAIRVIGPALLVLFCSALPRSGAQINVPTQRYNNARTGANLAETQLNTSNVNVNSFGKLWSYTVSGSVQAQPLYIQGVSIPGKGTRNVLYVATMNDVVYAFDGDSSSNQPLWSVDLTTLTPGATPVPINDIVGNGLNIVGNVGIESTPVIDLSSNTMYLVARTKENGSYPQRLHALNIATGAESFAGPVLIQGSVSGTGNASSSGTLTFDPRIHNQRSGLAFANGQVFIAWASHEDRNPYHGWVMAYSASTLKQTGIFCTTPDGNEGGIWMAGGAPVIDASNNVYFVAGNGDWNGTRNFGESFLKFGSTPGMPLLDWFTPDNWASLNSGDVDLGSQGPLLVPGTDLIIGGGKQSLFYLMHTGSLGHEQSGNGQIVQTLNNNSSEMKGGTVYWNRSGGAGPWLYEWANNGSYLKAYHFNGSTFDAGPVSQSTIASPGGASGGVLTLSANGSTAGSGIVWSSMPLSEDGDHGTHQGVLRAFNADDLTKEIWNSNLNSARDNSGDWPKFSPPLVVKGRVYMVSFPSDGISSTAVSVYGLLGGGGGTTTAPPAFSPAGGTFPSPQQVTVSDSTAGAAIHYTTDGSAPSTASPLYRGPIQVSGSMTLRAIALASGSTSTATAATYTINPAGQLAKTGWTLKYVDSQETAASNNAAINAFDNNNNSFWHTQYSGANPAPPHEIQISLGGTYTLGGFTYLPRQDGCSHGNIKQYEFYVSTDGVNWGTAVAAGQFDYGASYIYGCGGIAVPTARVIPFSPVQASYIRLRALSETGGNAWTSAAEINVLQQATLPQSAWTLKYVDSQETSAENGAAVNAFDGKANTFWHTQWSAASPVPPHEIQINLGATATLTGFTYLPRQDGCINGTVKQYEFYVSTDGVSWGSPVAAGSFNYGNATLTCGGATLIPAQQVNFNATTGHYIRFRALSEVLGRAWTSAAEINVLH